MDVRLWDTGPGQLTVQPVGEVDMATADALDAALADALSRSGTSEVVVDLAGVGFLDSSGIRVLVSAAATARRGGITFRVADPRPMVARVLRITSVGALLGLSADAPPPSAARGFRGLE
ncbi:STAS domain-containing protein [Micromonospora sp. WMMD812]|uniref:STAS domain-containing protein n=1 Tax=Micromonospora sp. WMMD812 TaxID=3015152 RepID=UPI00248B518B|nr:STAS domain-containing protein [Micromonospora sp. WMMD812]WBB70569.1 STAS domain-containing protein [Micromonospora sp. WMMD812]